MKFLVDTFSILLLFYPAICRVQAANINITSHPNWRLVNKAKCGHDDPTLPVVALRIVGGEKTRVGEFPWAVQLGIIVRNSIFGTVKKDYHCGGSLITPSVVLTAAHCMVAEKQANWLTYEVADVIVGLKEWKGHVEKVSNSTDCNGVQFEKIGVKKAVPHPEYLHAWSDVGLLHLERNASLSGCINTVCLPGPSLMSKDLVGRKATVAGWGAIDRRGKVWDDVLRNVVLPIVKCVPTRVNNRVNIICAGGIKGLDSCYGDSGGPLTLEENSIIYQVGVVSAGITTECGTNEPAIYTDVRVFMPWILDNLLR